MKQRSLVAVGGALLALAAAAPADAQRREGVLRVAALGNAPTQSSPGATFFLRGAVKNPKGRPTATGRVTFSIRKSVRSTRAQTLGGVTVRRVRPGRTVTFRKRVRVPVNAPARSYVVFACVKVKGSPARRCRVAGRRLTIRGGIVLPDGTTLPPGTGGTPSEPGTPPAPDNRTVSEKLRASLTVDNLFSHLRRFQAIADGANGNRAAGTEGYGASVQYVASQLEAAGYEARVAPFVFPYFEETGAPELERTAPTQETYVADEDVGTLQYSGTGEVAGTLQAVDINLTPPRDSTSGCEDEDFDGFVAGNIALIQRGVCTFEEKATNAEEAGAIAVIFFNQGNSDDPSRNGIPAVTMGRPFAIPTVGVTYAVGEELSDPGTEVRLRTSTINDERTSSNVIADTPGGDPNKLVVVGGHLDSVIEGPGINDNGTGVAFTLETAIQMAKQNITPTNKVRFVFWGGEEGNLLGSTAYVANLPEEELSRIALNLNFDMLGSPNFARFVYNGDGDGVPEEAGPPGSAEIERAFVDYFNSQGLATEPTAFDGRSDYGPFIAVGIPAGGLFSGAEGVKTQEQVALYGGQAGIAYDPNYHQAGDTIANVNPVGFKELADGAAHVTALYATDPALQTPVRDPAPRRKAQIERRLNENEYRGSHAIR